MYAKTLMTPTIKRMECSRHFFLGYSIHLPSSFLLHTCMLDIYDHTHSSSYVYNFLIIIHLSKRETIVKMDQRISTINNSKKVMGY